MAVHRRRPRGNLGVERGRVDEPERNLPAPGPLPHGDRRRVHQRPGLYDTVYQERNLGLPSGNPEGNRDGSPITFASRLRGNLLLVHGTGDDDCHYQSCERLVNALVAANRPFSMMAYPNRTHGISEGPDTSRHLYGTMTRFLEANLPPGPK